MGHNFICRVCSKGDTDCVVANVCAYINRSTAFPANILKMLKCPFGHKNSNWEYIEEYIDLNIPVNFKSALTQKELEETE